ncbi:hypothetical protein BWZ20_14085 [Winogradskyella sp. J14-2]|uniref:hypothetical protein n=1 Tax=Winogradskyella sp. J14-2 TaxID=1936080 RepID=UPI0009726F81|nr:hypothetical protein [Winogradskyella sp. J14-2]APY09364.1 hypothetical protein BWZ20_14085 [Winogradskyella sp. J14-2]
MNKVLYFFFKISLVAVLVCCSKSDPIPERLEVTINNEELIFNSIIVDRQATTNYRHFTAIINSNTNKIISFQVMSIEDSASLQNFSYTTRGKIYKVQQDSDYFNATINVNTNARFAMSFSGVLSTFNAQTNTYDAIQLDNGKMDVEY